MELRRDILLPVFVSIGLVLLTSFSSIGLLTRMAPAIERILEDNVASLVAVEEMLVLLSSDEHTLILGRFESALSRAEGNITDERERPHLTVVREFHRQALAGGDEARRRVVTALSELAAINRAAMVRADEDAKRMGIAGAWAAVLLGAVAFTWGLLVARRSRHRIFEPMSEVVDVLRNHDRGETSRRCRSMPAPAELMAMMQSLNRVLDEHERLARQPRPKGAPEDRAVLLSLLDQRELPTFVITPAGKVEAANARGLEALSNGESERIHGLLRACVAGEQRAEMRCWSVEHVGRWVCEMLE
jgi:hypothetical protein